MTSRDPHPVILFDALKEEIERGGSIELVLPPKQPGSTALWRVFLATADGVRYMLVRQRDIRPYEIKTPKGLFSFLRSVGIAEITVPVPAMEAKTDRRDSATGTSDERGAAVALVSRQGSLRQRARTRGRSIFGITHHQAMPVPSICSSARLQPQAFHGSDRPE